MIKIVLFILGIGLIIGFIINRQKERILKQMIVGVKKNSIVKSKRMDYVMNLIQQKTQYTETKLHRVTLLSLLLMIPGSALGIFFNNLELALLLGVLLGSLPFLLMMLKERRKQKQIYQEIVPLLTSLDWNYQSQSFSIKSALLKSAESCPEIIQKEYNLMLQKIHLGAEPSRAMSELAHQTRSTIFLELSGILRVLEKRNDPKSFREALKTMMKHIVKTNNRLSQVEMKLNKKKFFLFGLMATTVAIFYMSFSMMNDPMSHFRSSSGKTGLLIGVIACFIPFVVYFMSAFRRRF